MLSTHAHQANQVTIHQVSASVDPQVHSAGSTDTVNNLRITNNTRAGTRSRAVNTHTHTHTHTHVPLTHTHTHTHTHTAAHTHTHKHTHVPQTHTHTHTLTCS